MTYCRNTLFLDVYVNFLQHESNLERYLIQNPPTEANFHKARSSLRDDQRFFSDLATNRTARVRAMTELCLNKAVLY